MTGDTRLIKIVELLLRLTRAGRLEWDRIGTADQPIFATSFTDASFVIRSKDNDGAHPFIVELRNERGEVLESIQTVGVRPLRGELSPEDQEERRRGREFNRTLHDLYNAARRNAMNIDRFLDGVLAQLEAQSADTDND
ncbi:hypothetical protein ACWERF_08920 [Streptomyces griseoluteus]